MGPINQKADALSTNQAWKHLYSNLIKWRNLWMNGKFFCENVSLCPSRVNSEACLGFYGSFMHDSCCQGDPACTKESHVCLLWQYGLWSFQTGNTKFKVNFLYQKSSKSFSILFFIEEYQFRSIFFVIDIKSIFKSLYY